MEKHHRNFQLVKKAFDAGLVAGQGFTARGEQAEAEHRRAAAEGLEKACADEAERTFEGHDFGDNVVAGVNGWEHARGHEEWSRAFFLENPDGGDSVRHTFTVRFKKGSAEVVEKLLGLTLSPWHCAGTFWSKRPGGHDAEGIEMKAKFQSGRIVATPSALEALARSGQTADFFLDRHLGGDWGGVSAEDRGLNDQAVLDGSRILSAYRTLKDESSGSSPRQRRSGPACGDDHLTARRVLTRFREALFMSPRVPNDLEAFP